MSRPLSAAVAKTLVGKSKPCRQLRRAAKVTRTPAITGGPLAAEWIPTKTPNRFATIREVGHDYAGLAMRSWFVRAFAIAAVLSPVLAFAQAIPPGEEGELGKILPPVPGTRICYEKVFSAEDLAARPDQTVAAMTLRVAYYRHDPDEFHPEGQRNYYFNVVTRLRDKEKPLRAIGECAPWGDKVSCGVDCDGGGFTFTIAGKDTVLMDFGEDARLRMTPGCSGEADAVDFTPREADREFVLSKIDANECPAYEDWW